MIKPRVSVSRPSVTPLTRSDIPFSKKKTAVSYTFYLKMGLFSLFELKKICSVVFLICCAMQTLCMCSSLHSVILRPTPMLQEGVHGVHMETKGT